MLAITCIGLTVGAGFYEAAIYATLIILLILLFAVPIQQFLAKNRKTTLFTITATAFPGILGKIESVFTDNGVSILNINQYQETASQYTLLKILVNCSDAKIREKIIHELCEFDFIKEIYTSKKSYHHDAE